MSGAVGTGAGSWVGRAVPRAEDERFVRGQARYVSDLKLPQMLHAAFVRSLVAHGRLAGVDASAAARLPGVRAILTAADLDGDVAPFPLTVREGVDVVPVVHPVLARDRVRYVGEPVAIVVADSAEQAADGADAVSVDIDELPAIVDARAAEGGAPLHDESPDNVLLRARHAEGDVDGAFSCAHTVVRTRVLAPRIIAAPLETRAVLAAHDRADDVLTVWISAQDTHRQLAGLSAVLRRSADRLRVVVPDVGGAFGSKGVPQAETVAVACAALRLGRPVRWVETRTESCLAAYQGRGIDVDAELAVDRDGRMLALRSRVLCDLGAYLYGSTLIPPLTTASLLTGCYVLPAAEVGVVGVCTTKVPTGPYRGAGRPEAALTIERLADLAARELGLDPVELRRRNLVPVDAFPYRTALGSTYDSGDFAAALDEALGRAAAAGLYERRDGARAEGRLAGVGVALCVERVGPGWECAAVRVEADGTVVVRTGSSPHGQGHETTFAQIAADALGIAPGSVEVRWGDSFEIPTGVGTFASRSVAVGGSAVLLACRDARARLDAGEQPPVEASARFELPGPVFSSGAYVAAVEIDGTTGHVEIERIVAVDDCGRVVNPLLAEGQVVGAVVQAVGECVYEQVGLDEDGQPLAVNLYEYHLPTAQSAPPIDSVLRETPSPFNPLGAKGVGEGGSIGTPAALSSAVADALAPLGLPPLDPPFTPARVWNVLRESRSSQ